MGKFIDLTGQRFGKLTVINRVDDYVYTNGNKKAQWLCRCDCGKEKVIIGDSLKAGHTKSCGCSKIEYLKKYNNYDLSGDYGIGYTRKNEPFYFDLEDYDLIKNYCWYTNTAGYLIAKESITRKEIFLHRLLTNVTKDFIVDHINHKIYDNRKSNLRIVNHSKNAMNQKKTKKNTSGCTGVFYHSYHEKWNAVITVNRERIHLGYFNNKEDAIKVRKEAEEKYFGEHSYENSMKISQKDEVIKNGNCSMV